MVKTVDDVVADNIVKRRTLKGLNQTELAELAGFHPVSLNRVENLKIPATRKMLRELARVLDCQVSDFYAGVHANQVLTHSPTLSDVVKLLNAFQDATEERRLAVRSVLGI
jgi:transcriptional regulator with XRE-family HTH domain